jgi:hypothetical protein
MYLYVQVFVDLIRGNIKLAVGSGQKAAGQNVNHKGFKNGLGSQNCQLHTANCQFQFCHIINLS